MLLTVFGRISGNVINPNPQCLIEGITGEADIANFWRDHYGSLRNSSLNTTSKEYNCDSLKNISLRDSYYIIIVAHTCSCE